MNEAHTASSIQQIPGYNSAEALRIRLDTETILREVEAHLKGVILTEKFNEETQRLEIHGEKVGTPLANEEGQHRLLMWVRLRINHATVQGNFKRDDFNNLIATMMQNLNFELHLNSKTWGVTDSNIHYLITSLIDMVEIFLSRTVDNEERKLFGGITERRSESIKGGGFGFSGGKTWQ